MKTETTPPPPWVARAALLGLSVVLRIIRAVAGCLRVRGGRSSSVRVGRMICHSCGQKAIRQSKWMLLELRRWHQRCEKCGTKVERELRILKGATVARAQRRGIFPFEWTIHRPKQTFRSLRNPANTATQCRSTPPTCSEGTSDPKNRQEPRGRQTMPQTIQNGEQSPRSWTPDQPRKPDQKRRETCPLCDDSISGPND